MFRTRTRATALVVSLAAVTVKNPWLSLSVTGSAKPKLSVQRTVDNRILSRRLREETGLLVVSDVKDVPDSKAQAHMERTPFNKQFTTEIAEAGRRRDWHAVQDALACCEEMDSIIFSAAINAAKKCGRWQEGIALYEQMCSLGIERTATTYTPLFVILAGLDRYDEAKSLWADFKEHGLADDPLAMSMQYRAILSAAAQAGNVNDARSIFEEMMSLGLTQGLLVTFGMAMKACMQAQDAASARHFLHQMKRYECTPNIVVCTAAMSAHCHASLLHIASLESDMATHGIPATEKFVEAHVASLMGIDLGKFEISNKVVMEASCELNNARVEAASQVISRAKQHGTSLTSFVKYVDRALRMVVKRIHVSADESVDKLGFTITGFPPGAIVRIKHVETESWADIHGLVRGDLIVEVHGKATDTFDKTSFKAAMQKRPLQLRCVHQ